MSQSLSYRTYIECAKAIHDSGDIECIYNLQHPKFQHVVNLTVYYGIRGASVDELVWLILLAGECAKYRKTAGALK